jgi:hypothetical protein
MTFAVLFHKRRAKANLPAFARLLQTVCADEKRASVISSLTDNKGHMQCHWFPINAIFPPSPLERRQNQLIPSSAHIFSKNLFKEGHPSELKSILTKRPQLLCPPIILISVLKASAGLAHLLICWVVALPARRVLQHTNSGHVSHCLRKGEEPS